MPIIGVSGLGVGFGYVLYRIAKRRRSLKVTPMNEKKKPKKPEATQTEQALDAPSLGHQSSLAPLNMTNSVLNGTMTNSQLNGSTMVNSALTVGRNASTQPFNLTQEGNITQRITLRSPKKGND